MKVLFLMAVAIMPLAVSSSDSHLCPEGYIFAGEDSPVMPNEEKDVHYSEIDRTPFYSCYKLFHTKKDWISAMQTCWEDKAQLVSLEDPMEMNRVAHIYLRDIFNVHDHKDPFNHMETIEVLTSGFYFDEVTSWYWTSSNKSFNLHVEDEESSLIGINGDQECLKFRMKKSGDNEGQDYETTLISTMCFTEQVVEQLPRKITLNLSLAFISQKFLCEKRVQTVTYMKWFSANWFDLLMGLLVVSLFVALCISICAMTSKDHGQRAAQMRRQAGNQNNFNPVVIDLPPSYDSTVKVQRLESNPGVETAPVRSPGRMEYFKNRGRELMARVYVYKDRSNTTPTSSTN